MDLPELLEPERIRCHCDIHSKKRALQTVAELLGAALREGGDGGPPGVADAGAREPDGTDRNGSGSGRTNGTARRNGTADEPDGSGSGRDGGGERRGSKLRNLKEGRGGKRRGAERDGESAAEVSDMDILDALISRERLGSTGLGHGVALPHSRLDKVESPLAAMITLKDGVDFEAGDGEPVDLVLGLLVPRDCNDEHLKILANLARRFNDAELREELRGYDSGEELFAHLQTLAAV